MESSLGRFKDLTISAVEAEMSPERARAHGHGFVVLDPTMCGWYLLALEEVAAACHACRPGGGCRLGPRRRGGRRRRAGGSGSGGPRAISSWPTTWSGGASSGAWPPWASSRPHRPSWPSAGSRPRWRSTTSTRARASGGPRGLAAGTVSPGAGVRSFVQWDGNAVWGATVYWAHLVAVRLGRRPVARALRSQLEDLVRAHGFREFYDAWSGEPGGAGAESGFTWPALVLEMESNEQPPEPDAWATTDRLRPGPVPSLRADEHILASRRGTSGRRRCPPAPSRPTFCVEPPARRRSPAEIVEVGLVDRVVDPLRLVLGAPDGPARTPVPDASSGMTRSPAAPLRLIVPACACHRRENSAGVRWSAARARAMCLNFGPPSRQRAPASRRRAARPRWRRRPRSSQARPRRPALRSVGAALTATPRTAEVGVVARTIRGPTASCRGTRVLGRQGRAHTAAIDGSCRQAARRPVGRDISCSDRCKASADTSGRRFTNVNRLITRSRGHASPHVYAHATPRLGRATASRHRCTDCSFTWA